MCASAVVKQVDNVPVKNELTSSENPTCVKLLYFDRCVDCLTLFMEACAPLSAIHIVKSPDGRVVAL